MDELSETLRALADPSRRRQLGRLAQGTATSGELAELLSMSRPAGSQHLAVLVAAGLVRTAPKGRQRWHSIELERLTMTRSWLDEILRVAQQAGSGRDHDAEPEVDVPDESRPAADDPAAPAASATDAIELA
jgi:DNA-binding transcriptional ArsR family regulator